MQVRGNIGEEVYLRANIKEIHILDQDNIQYTLEIDNNIVGETINVGESASVGETHLLIATPNKTILNYVPENRIKFKLKPTDIVNNNIGNIEEKKKGPGRPPKKATVDSIMGKVENNEVKEIERDKMV